MSSSTAFISVGSHCPLCGKPYVYVGDAPTSGWTPGSEPYCTCAQKAKDYSTSYSVGWQCPVCKRVYAPWISECNHCNQAHTTFGSTSDWKDDWNNPPER